MMYKLGSHGDAVKQIQAKLGITADGWFGEQTRQAVIKFQQAQHIDADGIVGPQTWGRLFGSPEPTPDIPWPFYQSQCYDLFGDPMDAGFSDQWIIEYHFTVGENIFQINTNTFMVPYLEKAIANLNTAGIAFQWKENGGSYCVRNMRGGNSLSIHSWGLAIDINPTANPFHSADYAMTPQFVKCFKDAGFIWGGDWSWGSKDAMHFQLPRIG